MNLARQIHQEFLKQKGWSTTHTQKTVPLTKTQLDGFHIYVDMLLKIWLKKLKNHKNYKTEQYEIMVAIPKGICTDDHDQKIIVCQRVV